MKLFVDACVNTVPGKFIYTWLAFHNITFDMKMTVKKLIGAKKTTKTIITDATIVSQIKTDHQKFKKSKLSLEKFFDTNITFVTKCRGSFRIKDYSLSHNCIFVWLPGRESKDTPYVNYRIPIAELSSTQPIKMAISDIPKLFDINQPFESILDLENTHNIAIDLFSTDGKAHWRSPDLPGFKAGNVDFRIKIAQDVNGETYWIPPMTRSPNAFICTKFPGKCRYEAVNNSKLKRHMEKCIAETQLVTEKVFFTQ